MGGTIVGGLVYLRYRKSDFIDIFSTTPVFEPMQAAFRSLSMGALGQTPPGHTHGRAAGFRLQADNFISDWLRQTGLSEYVISKGRRDYLRGRKGVREYHTAKDLQMRSSVDDKPVCDFAYRLVDVDYYVDLNELLEDFRPVIMYTFSPLTPSGTLPDGYYVSTGNNMVRVHIQGGGQYEHPLWDYETDHIQVTRRGWTYVYLVEQRRVPGDEHHKVVVLIPVRKYWNMFGILSLPGHTMDRRRFSFGKYAKMTYMHTDDGHTERYTAMSPIGEVACAVIPDPLLYNMYQRVARSKDSIIASLEGTLRVYFKGETTNFLWKTWKQRGDPAIYAAIVCDVLENHRWLVAELVKTQSLVQSAIHYTALNDQCINEQPKPTVRCLVTQDKAYLDGAAAPTSCKSNDLACVEGRIIAPRNPNKPVPDRYNQYVDELFAHMIPEEKVGTGFPVSADVVSERQKRPSQQTILKRVRNWLYYLTSTTVASFQKRECYAKYTHPRNISTIPGARKMEYSMFTYAMADLFHEYDFYAFARTPKEIEQRVSRVLENARAAYSTDFSLMDGSHGAWLSSKEEQFAMRYFAKEFHTRLTSLMKGNFNARGFTTYGVEYSTGDSRLSGSPDTSIANTLDNVIIAFITLREMGYEPADAYSKLGVYGGDDGMTVDVKPSIYQAVAARLGMTLKCEAIQRNQPVPFLGRYFGGPWGGDMWSVCDVPRQLKKLHVTTADAHTPDWVVMMRKALGFSHTDPNTPIIGVWSNQVLSRCRALGLAPRADELEHSDRFFERYDRKDQFTPCRDGGDYELVSSLINIGVERLLLEEQRLRGLAPTAAIADFFNKLVVGTTTVKLEVVAGANILQPDPVPTIDQVVEADRKELPPAVNQDPDPALTPTGRRTSPSTRNKPKSRRPERERPRKDCTSSNPDGPNREPTEVLLIDLK
jgi:hypothetical protein